MGKLHVHRAINFQAENTQIKAMQASKIRLILMRILSRLTLIFHFRIYSHFLFFTASMLMRQSYQA